MNMADDSSLAMAKEVSVVHVTKDGLEGDQGTNGRAKSGVSLISPLE